VSEAGFWAAVAAIGVAIGWLRGGDPANALRLRLRFGWALLGLLVADLVVLPRLAGFELLTGLLPWATFIITAGALAIAGVNWTVLRPLPAWVVGIGLNAAYALANGGRSYVVRPAAFATSTIPLPDYVALPWLAAWIPLPPDGWLSPGDLVIAVAAVIMIQAAMRRPA
jgi:hypothetical protein